MWAKDRVRPVDARHAPSEESETQGSTTSSKDFSEEQDVTEKPTLFEATKISSNPLDYVKIGDWYWVKCEPDYENKKEHEHLFCVDEIGSNFVGFCASSHHGTYGTKVHFDQFFSRCRPESNWREYLQTRMNELQAAIREKTKELVEHGQKLCLLEQPRQAQQPAEQHSLLPMKVADEPKRYKKELVKLQKDTLPKISKEIDELAKDYAVVAKDMALPDLVKLEAIKEKLGVVEDRIFTIELYCGLQEDVHQIAEGEPAPASEKIAIRQALLYMDEETLFDYEDGGMDFKKIGQFDKWVVKPENLNRILPEQKGVVAFRVRRGGKDYGTPSSVLQAWTQIEWAEANKQTYLLIRNGERVYRIASEINFSPRLIPMRGEIGEEQFKKIDRRFDWEKHAYDESEELITPASVDFDEHVKQVDALLKQYNRIVILIQGLLDRSTVFHPHPPVNLTIPGVLDEWVKLIRDEEDGLPCNKVTWDDYRQQLNKTLRKGKWVYIRYPKIEHEKYQRRSYYNDPDTGAQVYLPFRGWAANGMPTACKVESVSRDKTKVMVSWPWGNLANPKEGKWISNPKRPGWGHYESIWETDRVCHEAVPVKFVINMSDYSLGDYKMFLCDRALKGAYLEWAPFLLTAEDWARERAKGAPAEDYTKAQARRR